MELKMEDSELIVCVDEFGNYAVPAGYVLLPVAKLDRPIYTVDNDSMSVLFDRDAFAVTIARYTEYLKEKLDYDLISNALKKAGWCKDVPLDGNSSDGFHTFNELYHHRAILFSKIVQMNKDRAWKSKKHSDGTMFDGGWFIVGLDTPEGQATYHYAVDPYWDIFDCKELENAPEWDGHTAEDAINRIERFDMTPPSDIFRQPVCKSVERWYGFDIFFKCSRCGFPESNEIEDQVLLSKINFCPKCGAEVLKQ